MKNAASDSVVGVRVSGEWDLRICTSNKLSIYVDTAGPCYSNTTLLSSKDLAGLENIMKNLNVR